MSNLGPGNVVFFAPANDDGGDGMDPWQASVEKRLDSLDSRMGRVETGLSDVKVNVATLAERITHLPSRGFVVTSAVGTVTALTAIIIFLQKIGLLT